MTTEQFDETEFTGLMNFEYVDGKIYDFRAVDYKERLIELIMGNEDDFDDAYRWVRCENVKLNSQ